MAAVQDHLKVVEPEWQSGGMNDVTEPIGVSTGKGIVPGFVE